VVSSILTVLVIFAFVGGSILHGAKTRNPSQALIGIISVALQAYSSDFNGLYPPDDCENTSAGFYGGAFRISNSSHALCVYLTANNISSDSRASGCYLPFHKSNLLNNREKTFAFNYSYSGGTTGIKGVDDYVVDSFGTPVVYDERKSEKANDGLNFYSFVLISGGGEDKKEDITLKDADKGRISMFSEENMKNIDTHPSDYRNSIPDRSSQENDDILNW